MSIFKSIQEKFDCKKKQFMSNVSKPVLDLVRNKKRISLFILKQLRINSYEQHLIVKRLDTEALIYQVENALKNSNISEIGPFDLPKHYDDALIRLYLFEMLKHLKQGLIENEQR